MFLQARTEHFNLGLFYMAALQGAQYPYKPLPEESPAPQGQDLVLKCLVDTTCQALPFAQVKPSHHAKQKPVSDEAKGINTAMSCH